MKVLWIEKSLGLRSKPSSVMILSESRLKRKRKSLAVCLAITFFSALTFWLLVVLCWRFLRSYSSILRLRAASILCVSINSASLICKNSLLCLSSSVFSNASIASIWASSRAFPTRTCRTGSASSSKSKRSLSRSFTWMSLGSPSGFGTKIGEGYSGYEL
jgi:hypothetical protein